MNQIRNPLLQETLFDEEADDFAAPVSPLPRRVTPLEGIAYLLLVLGSGGFLASILGWIGGGWGSFLFVFGSLTAGGVLLPWARYGNTSPGVKNDRTFFRGISTRGITGWAAGVLLTGFYVVLYWRSDLLEGGIRLVDPLALVLTGEEAGKWFLYGFLYSLAVLLFGFRMILRWRGNPYQILRTFSVIFFQLGLAFLLPHLLALFEQPEFYFTYFWPLKTEYLWPSGFRWLASHPGGLGVFMAFWGLAMTFLATPVLTYFFGKRWYCSWVCGCGGLAETMGDPWRHLSNKSDAVWRIERISIYTILAVVTAGTAVLWINSAMEGGLLGTLSQGFAEWYGFLIGSLFAGVIGVGFYPLMGPRVWCRFGCPMAAILGLLQVKASRFRIETNGGQCMSCGNCSTYCEMGIDVRSYAQKGDPILRASCVGCGLCSSVCPRGVLRLGGRK